MHFKKLIALALIFIVNISFSQIIEKKWEQFYSDQDSLFNTSTDVTNSGDLYVSGFSNTLLEGRNIVTIKYDSNGNELWVQEFHSTLSDIAIENTCDALGNVYTLGQINVGSNGIAVVIKYNSSGVFQWTYTETLGTQSIPVDIQMNGSNELLVLGRHTITAQEDVVMTAINATSGTQTNQFIYDSGGEDFPINFDVHGTKLTMAISSYNGSATSSSIIQLDNNLVIDWTHNFNSSNWEDIKAIKYDSQGNLIIVLNVDQTLNTTWVSKFSASGSLLWELKLDDGNSYANGRCLFVDASDNLIACYSHSQNEEVEANLIDENGLLVWNKKLYATNSLFTKFSVTSDGNRIIIGGTELEMGTMGRMKITSLDYESNIAWEYRDVGEGNQNRMADFDINTNGHVIVTGGVELNNGLYQIAVIDIDEREPINAPDLSGNPSSFLAYFDYADQVKDLDGNTMMGLKYYGNFNDNGNFLFDKTFAHSEIFSDGDTTTTDTIVRWDFIFGGSFTPTTPVGINPAGHYVNHYYADVKRERMDAYKKVVYPNIYSGIDMEIGQNSQGNVIYFVVHPGADLNDIQFMVDGATPTVGANGNLVNTIFSHQQQYEKPLVYTIDNGSNTTVQNYDPNLFGYEVDINQNVSFNFPAAYNAFGDVLVIEMHQSGTPSSKAPEDNFRWSSYIRNGANSSYNSKLSKVVTDQGSNSYYAGSVEGSQGLAFPATVGAPFEVPQGSDDVTIMKLNADVERVWATYYGGMGQEFATSIAIDDFQRVFVVGEGGGTDFPLNGAPGSFMQSNPIGSFIIELTAAGLSSWSTTIAVDHLADCEIIDNGLFVVGEGADNALLLNNFLTYYSDFGEGYIGVFKTGGFYLHGSNFGSLGAGNDHTQITAIDWDGADNFAITGATRSPDFPVAAAPGIEFSTHTPSPGGITQAFVANIQLAAGIIDFAYFLPRTPLPFALQAALGSDYYFQSVGDRGNDVKFTPDGQNVYVVGETFNDDFYTQAPTSVNGYFQPTRPFAFDFSGGLRAAGFIYKTNTLGAVDWSTFYSPGIPDYGCRLEEIDFDSNNNFFISGHQIEGAQPINPQTGASSIPVAPSQPLAFYSAEVPSYQSHKTNFINASVLYPESFIIGFNEDEEYIWSTYLGGYKSDQVKAIATSPNNRLYFGGMATTINGQSDLDADFFPASEAERRIFDFPRWEYDETFGSIDWFNGTGAGDECEVAGFFDITDVNIPGSFLEVKNYMHNDLLVYPNPTDGDVLRIIAEDDQIIKVEIYSIIGSKVLEVNQIDLSYVFISSLEAGTYIIKALGLNEKQYTTQFIKL
jgi:hypothetical protein